MRPLLRLPLAWFLILPVLLFGNGSSAVAAQGRQSNCGRPVWQRAVELGEFRELSVLYAGVPDTGRAYLFVEFLKTVFGRVGTLDVEQLDQASTLGFDVVVADWTDRFENGRFVGPQDIENRLGADFSRPVILIGALSGRLPLGTKFKHL